MDLLKKTGIRITIIIIVLTIICKVTGFLREMVIASSFGASYQTDAYFMSLAIPNIVFNIIAVAATATLIPKFGEVLRKDGREGLNKFASNLFWIFLFAALLFLVILEIILPNLTKIIAPSFDRETFELTVYLSRISIIGIVFMTINALILAILQSFDEYVSPAISGLAINIPIIIYVFICKDLSIVGLTIATLSGYLLQVFIQVPWLLCNGFRLKKILDIKDTRLKEMMILMLPAFFGICANQINFIINRAMASGLPEGSISSYNYANVLNGVSYGIFVSSFVMLYYSRISRAACADIQKETIVVGLLESAITKINLFMFPTTLAVIVLSREVVLCVYGRGAFNYESVATTAYILKFLAFGMLFNGMRDMFDRTFYAFQNTGTPVLVGVLGVAINIILNFLLVPIYGVTGLAASLSIASIISCIMLLFLMKKKLNIKNYYNIFGESLKIFFSAFFMILCILYANKFVKEMTESNIILLVISFVEGIIFYIIFLLLFRVKIIINIFNVAYCKLKNGVDD